MSAPLHFQPQLGSAVDEENRIAIYRPRLVPAEAPYDIEYQYSIFKDDKPFEGIGLFVTDSWARGRTSDERVFAIDLTTPQAIKSAIDLKPSLGVGGDDLTFLFGLSHGLVAVFQSRTDNSYFVRYVVVANAEHLYALGLRNDHSPDLLTNGHAILAQTLVAPNGSPDEYE